MIRELICINCPMGCRMTVTLENGAVTDVTGNTCPRGRDYAIQEATRPLRVLTGIMKAEGCPQPFSVRSDGQIPKDMIRACAAELKKHHPPLPVQAGDIVIADILGTGVNIIATSHLDVFIEETES
ncbi:MAG: DUF1667 domain-containing protein [Lachnospiraceae bacterium]|nr:DUF1667 domain-containing protein [Lachnospiraceae bacterium]